MLLLDSNVAIHLRDGDPQVRRRVAGLREEAVLSVVTVVELEGGIAAQPQWAEKRRLALAAMTARFDTLPFTAAEAEAYGNIVRSAKFSRRTIIDRMIAATALTHGLRLVTMNAADFRDVPELKVEDWSETSE